MLLSCPPRRAPRLALGAVLLALACGVSAQRVYKSVAADGKVTFSDQPVPGQQGVPARTTWAAAATAPTAQAAAGPGQALARSLTSLQGVDHLVNAAEQLCNATLPDSMKKYALAGAGWRERHRLLLERRDAIVARTLSPRQRAELRDAGRADARRVTGPVLTATAVQRAQWCDKNAAHIEAGQLDRHQDPEVAGPLLAWQGASR
ncbi:MAG: hypothetical protein JWP65_2928 [Ramlibacter sp.]|jgi:hypothetical protein|uniref:DUF4124 domain-containing protein n=1 Tax=Ramlibacter sp. TaxID=1917967 RepID=UPI00263508A4|nr:DUF4124 domain-containing protein [Ramlibacter sp.]MDB5752507.1 hypothetical protein [Ramlibacter sp.]